MTTTKDYSAPQWTQLTATGCRHVDELLSAHAVRHYSYVPAAWGSRLLHEEAAILRRLVLNYAPDRHGNPGQDVDEPVVTSAESLAFVTGMDPDRVALALSEMAKGGLLKMRTGRPHSECGEMAHIWPMWRAIEALWEE